MPIFWPESIAALDRHALAALYQAAPLGSQSVQEMQAAFTRIGIACLCGVAVLPSHQGTSLGRQVVSAAGPAGAGHRKTLPHSMPGKEGFYKHLGFKRMRTATAIFRGPAAALARGHIADTWPCASV